MVLSKGINTNKEQKEEEKENTLSYSCLDGQAEAKQASLQVSEDSLYPSVTVTPSGDSEEWSSAPDEGEDSQSGDELSIDSIESKPCASTAKVYVYETGARKNDIAHSRTDSPVFASVQGPSGFKGWTGLALPQPTYQHGAPQFEA